MGEILKTLQGIRKLGYKSISQVGGIKKAKELFASLKEMKDAGGMLLCEKCTKRKIKESNPDVGEDEALKQSLASGMYKEAPKGVNCFLCEEEAKYIIKDPMGAVKKHTKKPYPGGDKK